MSTRDKHSSLLYKSIKGHRKRTLLKNKEKPLGGTLLYQRTEILNNSVAIIIPFTTFALTFSGWLV